MVAHKSSQSNKFEQFPLPACGAPQVGVINDTIHACVNDIYQSYIETLDKVCTLGLLKGARTQS